MPADGGIRFGQYVLLRRIARGGMAEVFLAQQRGLEGFDRRVAVKRILPHLADSPDFVKMFLAEAKLAAQLSHPNVVHIYEFGKVAADYFIAMEFVDGVHAGQLFDRAVTEPLPVTLVARLGADAAAALHHAHELRTGSGKPLALVHRDVSPANLMVSFDGVVKLCDFGIAKAAALTDAKTNPGHVKGKYAYMSPEQTIAAPLDGRSDVFSLAIVLWELLAGRTIVPRTKDAIDVMRAIRDGKLPAIDDVVTTVPRALSEALRWALQTKPADRATAAELAQALEAFIKASPELATPMQLGAWVRDRFPRDAAAAAATPGTDAAPGTAGGPRTGAIGTHGDGGGDFSDLATRDPGDSGSASVDDYHPDADDDVTIAAKRPMAALLRGASRPLPTTPLAAPPRPSPDEAATVPTPKVARDRDARGGGGERARTPVAGTSVRERAATASPAMAGPSAPTAATAPTISRETRSTRAPLPAARRDATPPASPPNQPKPAPPIASAASAPTDSRRRRLQTTLVAGPRRVRIGIAIAGVLVLGIASFLVALATRSTHAIVSMDAGGATAIAPSPDARAATAAIPASTTSDAGAGAKRPSVTSLADAGLDRDTHAALLEVVSTPTGATVRVGDQTRIAPAQFALPAGTYTVSFELAGYEREQRAVELPLGDHLRLDVVLVKAAERHVDTAPPTATTGRLTVRTTPYSVVYLGGTELGETPFADVEVAAGTYTLRFENPQHGTTLRKVTIAAGKTTKLAFALP